MTLLGVSLAKNPLYLVTEFCAKVSVSAPWEYLLLIEKLQVTSTELSATCPQQPKCTDLGNLTSFKCAPNFVKLYRRNTY